MKLLLIDADFILYRNSAMVFRGNGEVRSGPLTKSFILSVWKIQKQHMADKVILCWDKKPYHKEGEIEEYKGDRVYASDDDVKALNEKAELELDPIKKKEIEDEAWRTNRSIESYKARGETKYSLINSGSGFGMQSVIKKGYEADDLAYLIAHHVHTSETIYDSVILASIDGDWIGFVNPITEYHRTNKAKDVHLYEDEVKKIPEQYRTKVTLAEWHLIHQLYYGNHNGINIDKELKNTYDLESIVNFSADRTTVPDPLKNFFTRLDCMDALNYYDQCKSYLSFLLSAPSGGKIIGEWYTYEETYKTGLWPNVVGAFMKSQNSEAFA